MTQANAGHLNESREERTIPVHLLSGFLGSGKTTLLNHLIDYYKMLNVKAAVVMNELGDVNLDGQFVDSDVPMAEMLSGCICCTIRGDLSMELKQLIDEHNPDVVIIESTGAANPMEIMDAITETALLTRVDLRVIATVVDGPELLERSRKGGRTYKLMQDQIRCATDLIVNKSDKLNPEDLVTVQQLVRELNAFTPLTVTIKCVTDLSVFDLDRRRSEPIPPIVHADQGRGHGHDHHVCGANCSHDHNGHGEGAAYVSHEHVMTLTHYFPAAIDSYAFEELIRRLPKAVYRAKGIVTFTDTNSRFLFQYAYGEVEFIRIAPQGKVNDVAVFIGEHFPKEALLQELLQLDESFSQE
ncbi:CobW family GTP-binding protein [Paenibacillus solisilvae]|uniref:CobW family GTP-binding protein n=1 Tax=Paenibacillus solisilvae TaxID=2486751 RepID=A0ABW0VY34_9BACL